MPLLRKALKDVAMEKDAAVVARVLNYTTSLFGYTRFLMLSATLIINPYTIIGGSFYSASHPEKAHKRS